MKDTRRGMKWTAAALLLAASLSSTGCQITAGGQTLPSADYMNDDVQYFAPGSEFKLMREAAALQAFKAEQRSQGGGN